MNFRGSIATFCYSRQAVGTYKCSSDVSTARRSVTTLRHGLPQSREAAAADADVQGHQRAGVLAGDEAGEISDGARAEGLG